MSARTPIQVPEELKNEIDSLKDSLHSKTHYEVIEKLVKSHHSYTTFKNDQAKKWNDEKSRQQNEMLQVGSDTKKAFNLLKDKLGLKSEEDLTILLLDHFSSADQMKKGTFNMYLKLRNK